MSNNEILHTANDTAIDKTIQLTKMYHVTFYNDTEDEAYIRDEHIVTEFFIIVGCYDQDPVDYVRAYCEIHRHENKEITNFDIEEATHHEPDLNLLDLSYGHSDKGLAVYDHSNCTIASLNYGWDLDDVMYTIKAHQDPLAPKRPTGSIPITYGDNVTQLFPDNEESQL